MSMSSDHHHHHHHHHTKDAVPPTLSSSSLNSSSSSSNVRHTHTHLTYSRHHLVGTAMETIKIAENGEYINSNGTKVELKNDLDYAVENCVHYDHEFDFYAALQLYDMENNCGTNTANNGVNLLGSLDEAEGGGGASASASASAASRRQKFGRKISSGSVGGGSNRSLNNNSNNNNDETFGSLHSSNLLKFSFNGSLSSSLSPSKARLFPRTSFLVVSASWLEAASELLNASSNSNNSNPNNKTIRVGVLNSASGTTPGGRFLKGTVSQEDCLCRASLLYSCISQPKFQSDIRFYGKNRSLRYGSSNCVIFSPDVPVIRKDNVEGKLLDNYEKVSFVTIPAPNAFTTSTTNPGKEYKCDLDESQNIRHRKNPSHVTPNSPLETSEATDFDQKFELKRRALLSSLSDRIHRALSAFVLGNCTDLILPAFGCGIHGNDPSMVASVFREMLTDQNQFGGRFRTVVFAIPPSRKHNYQAFAAYFQNKERAERAERARFQRAHTTVG